MKYIDTNLQLFSMLITIFSVALSVLYPMSLRIRGDIDKKYNLPAITHTFSSEPDFKRYNRVVFISLIITFILFAVMKISLCCWIVQNIIVSLQFLLLIILAYQSTRFIRLILTYQDENKLTNYFCNQPLTNRPESDILGKHLYMCIYAENSDNYAIYKKNIDKIIQIICIDRSNKKTNDLCNALFVINNIAIYKHLSYDIISLFLSDNISMTNLTYKFLWNHINNVIEIDNEKSFSDYWVCAYQYYNFIYTLRVIEEHYEKENKENEELFYYFNYMVTINLLYNKKDNWLGHILFFTQSQPPKYPLIPNTFNDLIADAKHFIMNLDDIMFQLSIQYPLSNNTWRDVNDSFLYTGYLYDYFAILYIRLFMMDYNVEYAEPLAIPPEEKKVQDNEKIIKFLNILQERVQKLLNNKNLMQQYGLNVDTQNDEIIKPINEYIKCLDEDITQKTNNPKIDKDKKNDFLGELSTSFSKQPFPDTLINNGISLENTNIVSIELYKTKLPKECFNEYDKTGFSNLPQVIVDSIRLRQRIIYKNILDRNKATNSYIIKYLEIANALQKLKREDDKYYILSNNINWNAIKSGSKDVESDSEGNYKYKGIAITELSLSCDTCIYIFEQNNMPKVNYTKIDSKELSEKANQCKCSDFEELVNEKDQHTMAYYNTKFEEDDYNLYILNRMLISPIKDFKFVKLTVVDYLYTNEKSDFDKIKPFNL